jgi:hypothetical protein
MTLDDEDLERIARRVAEVVAASSAHSGRKYVDATKLARILDVERDWVYANARRLGARRLSEPAGRLRFDLARVDEALAGPEPMVRPPRSARSRRRDGREPRTAVIEYEQ